MDNLTHSLVGLVAAKAGLERLSPSATSLCVLAANAPDADIVVLLFGDRWDFLQQHRGITHSLLGTVCLALLIPLAFYAGDSILARVKRRAPGVSLKGMLIASAVVSATHPLMDWTNNYGVRLLLPWNPKWFYGDLVFIVDPFMWLVLGGAAFLLTSRTKRQKLGWLALGSVLTLLVVAGSRSGGLSNPNLIRTIWALVILLWIILFALKAGERLGVNLARVSLLLVVLYWSGLAYAHRSALNTANSEALSLVRPSGETILKLAAMPTLANPLRWDCIFETNRATYRFQVSLANFGQIGRVVRYEKPNPFLSAAVNQVVEDRRVKVFLGFARFPVATLEDLNCTTRTLVQFADLRYTEPGRSRGTFSLELPVDCPNAVPLTTK